MSQYFLRETKSPLKFKNSVGNGKKSSFAGKLQAAKQKLEKFNLLPVSPGTQSLVSSDTESSLVAILFKHNNLNIFFFTNDLKHESGIMEADKFSFQFPTGLNLGQRSHHS